MDFIGKKVIVEFVELSISLYLVNSGDRLLGGLCPIVREYKKNIFNNLNLSEKNIY